MERFLAAARDPAIAVPLDPFEVAAARVTNNAPVRSSYGIPNEFLDITEEVCRVRYDEGWMAMS